MSCFLFPFFFLFLLLRKTIPTVYTHLALSMASNFVSLVGETRKNHGDHLDSILRRYPGALAQTLFLGFFIAFPMQVMGGGVR